jgi:hypothetical protein
MQVIPLFLEVKLNLKTGIGRTLQYETIYGIFATLVAETYRSGVKHLRRYVIQMS